MQLNNTCTNGNQCVCPVHSVIVPGDGCLYYRSGTRTLTDPYKTLYIYVGMCSSHSIYHIQVHILPGPVTVSLSSEVLQTEDRIITGGGVQSFWDGILDKQT